MSRRSSPPTIAERDHPHCIYAPPPACLALKVGLSWTRGHLEEGRNASPETISRSTVLRPPFRRVTLFFVTLHPLAAKREALTSERDAFLATLHPLTPEREGFTPKRDAFFATLHPLTPEREGFTSERDAFFATLGPVTLERDAFQCLSRDLNRITPQNEGDK